MKTGIILGLFLWGIIAAVSFITGAFFYNDTDDQINRTHSGLTLYKDYGTGCEYVSAGHFNLAPRTGANGSHKGCNAN